jgi:hypothetical protein
MMTAFLNNVTKHISQIGNAAGRLIAQFITTVYGQVPKLVLAGINVIINFLQGVAKAVPRVVNSALDIAEKFINALARGLLRLVNVGFNAMIRFMNGLADSIRRNEPRMFAAGMNIAGAIVQGMMVGMLKYAQHLFSKAIEIAKHLVHILKHPWDIFSPSRVTQDIGKNIMLGMAVGIDKNAPAVYKSANAFTSSLKRIFDNSQNIISDSVPPKPVITPVLDLSKVQKDAPKIAQAIEPSPISPAILSFDRTGAVAGAVAADMQRAGGTFNLGIPGPTTSVTFEQNNFSPDPLSNIEIYRQTNNQLSRIKSIIAT